MKIEKGLLWLCRFLLLSALAVMIFFSGITLALFLVRVLPFVSPFLSANVSSISSSQGAQFISAAFPVREANQAILNRVKLDPLLPFFVGVAILRKIKPVDNLFKRFVPPRNNVGTAAANQPNLNMEIPDISNVFESDGSLSGVIPGDNLRHFKGRYLNFSLSFLFVLLVIVFVFLTTWFITYFINSFNGQSKKLVSGTAQLSEELQALPAVLDEIYQKDVPIKKKTVSRSKKKIAS